MEGREIRIKALGAAFILLALHGTSSAIETRRGVIRQTQVLTCLDRCDYLHLEPDSGYAFVYLQSDPLFTVNLNPYIDTHVEVTGYLSGCGGCADLYVSVVTVLNTAGVGVDRNFPPASLLRQNYPNPFNPSTTIEYILARESNVTVKIFDLLGREVSLLVAAGQHAGQHTLLWDASGQPGGVYFYRLVASTPEGAILTQSRAMVLLR